MLCRFDSGSGYFALADHARVFYFVACWILRVGFHKLGVGSTRMNLRFNHFFVCFVSSFIACSALQPGKESGETEIIELSVQI